MPMFSTIVDIDGTAVYPLLPQITIPFKAEKISAFNMDEDGDRVAVSFDGKEDAGVLPAGVALHWCPSADGIQKVWVREEGSGKPNSITEVQIVAEV